jgi:hypothetical protein
VFEKHKMHIKWIHHKKQTPAFKVDPSQEANSCIQFSSNPLEDNKGRFTLWLLVKCTKDLRNLIGWGQEFVFWAFTQGPMAKKKCPQNVYKATLVCEFWRSFVSYQCRKYQSTVCYSILHFHFNGGDFNP